MTRFVRVLVDDSDIHVWGLTSGYGAFMPIWCEDHEFMVGEFGEVGDGSGLMQTEVDSVVDAEDVHTPDEAWAALAAYRLLGGANNG